MSLSRVRVVQVVEVGLIGLTSFFLPPTPGTPENHRHRGAQDEREELVFLCGIRGAQPGVGKTHGRAAAQQRGKVLAGRHAH